MGKLHISKFDLTEPSIRYYDEEGRLTSGQTNQEFIQMCIWLSLDLSNVLITPIRLTVASSSLMRETPP